MKRNYFLIMFAAFFAACSICLQGCGSSSDQGQIAAENLQADMPTDSNAPSEPDASPRQPEGNEPTEPDSEASQDPMSSTSPESPGSEEASSVTTPSTSGKLHVEGTQLVGEDGSPVQLRGISTHGLAWFPDFVNEECFSQFRNEWNVNVMRLAMYTAEYGGYCSGGDSQSLKNLVRSGIQYAASQDMYVIVDWHILSDGNPNTHVEEAKSFFGEITAEFAESNHILYEICNEPNGGTSWEDVKAYAEQVIPVIRSNDPDAVILVGTPNWCQYVDQAAADPITGYDNLMYTLHYYAATHKEDLRARMVAALSDGLPIFVSEYGICDASGNGALDIEQANQWIAEMDRYGISYVAWNLSNKDESSAILKSSCTKTSGFSLEDLSDSGTWLYQMLSGKTEGYDDNPSRTNPTDAPAAEGDITGNTDNPPAESGNEPNEEPHDISQTASSDQLEMSLQTVNHWESDGRPFYQYSLTLKNIGTSPCAQWAVDLPFAENMTLTDSWNGIFSVQGNTLHISSMDYNGTIQPDGTVTDIGFIVSGGEISL